MIEPQEFSYSNEPERFDAARMDQLRPVQEAVDRLDLPLLRSRKIRAIVNVLSVQIEDRGDSPAVNGLLLDALRAAVRHQVGEDDAAEVLGAIATFAELEVEHWEQVRAGTLPTIPMSPEEQIDGLVNRAFSLKYTDDLPLACENLLEAWGIVKELTKPEWTTTDQFDGACPDITAAILEWTYDLETDLAIAAETDPRFEALRLQYVREFMEQFPDEDPDAMVLFLRGEAEALWALDRRDEAEAAFARIAERFPDDVASYLGWAHQYLQGEVSPDAYQKAKAILLTGLAREDLDDEDYVELEERLEEMYEAHDDREGKAELLAQRAQQQASWFIPPAQTPESLRRPGLPLVSATPPVARPSRNAPCWCGSGKKYKKCHLDADRASVR